MGRSSTSFQPGRSGNPGGRPAALAEVQQLARAETAANVRALVRIRDAEDSPPAAVVAAVSVLFDRAFGKPAQMIVGDAEQTVSYVIRAPSPVESAEQWLAMHAPSDLREQREPQTIEAEAEPEASDAQPPAAAADPPSAAATDAWHGGND